MSDFNKATATADELWDHCIMEYENPNPIVKYLFDNLFARIREIVSLLGENDRLLEVGCGAGVSSLRILDMLSGQEFGFQAISLFISYQSILYRRTR